MQNRIEFQVNYKQKSYIFANGSEAYIFHTGIYNEVDKKYGMKALLKYVSLTHDSYLVDDNRTPLGAFADFVAEKWKKAKRLDRHDLMIWFYESGGGLL